MEIIFENLPKVSTNKIYAGKHFSYRQKIKDAYALIIPKKYHSIFQKEFYSVHYKFEWKKNALDCTNCSFMVKILEDILFASDAPKYISTVTITSLVNKDLEVSNKVTIFVKQKKFAHERD